MSPLLLLLALSVPLAAQGVGVEREELKVIGWNDACSVSLSHLVFPRLGEGIRGEPVSTKVGALTIAPGEEKAATKWFYEAEGTNTWNASAIAKVSRALRKLGYTRKGYPETVRALVSGAQPGLAETLLSTGTLALRPGIAWPGREWRWGGANYSPLGTCALLVFESVAAPPRYEWRLARVYNPRARLERSYAHATNSRLLFSDGELEAARLEAETAAGLAPESAVARYVYAAMLAMSGQPNESMVQLRAAIAIDPKRAKEAKEDHDFENLRPRRDFRDLVGSSYLDRLTREAGTDTVKP